MPVYKKDAGSWRVRIWTSGNRQDWVIHGSKRDAQLFESEQRIKIAAQSGAQRVAPRFSELCLGEYTQAAKLKLRPTWWRNQRYVLASLIEEFNSCRLTELTAARVEKYANKRKEAGCKNTTVNNELRVLNRVLNFARKRGYIVPERKWDFLAEDEERKVRAWTGDELDRLFRAVTIEAPQLLPLCVFLANTGCRKGEALALQWEHVDHERRQVKIWPNDEWRPKNGKPREVPIGSSLEPWLKNPRGKYVFQSATGERWASWPGHTWGRVVKAAGLTGGVHQLRHTYASRFLASTPDLPLLAQILGHSDTAVTKLYMHFLPSHLERARDAVNVVAPVGVASYQAAMRWNRPGQVLIAELPPETVPATVPEPHRKSRK